MTDIEETMLTTTDNPYNPFTQFDDWYAFDVQKGYYTCAYLARVAPESTEIGEREQALAIEGAIDDIVRLNVLGIYIKVTKNGFKSRV